MSARWRCCGGSSDGLGRGRSVTATSPGRSARGAVRAPGLAFRYHRTMGRSGAYHLFSILAIGFAVVLRGGSMAFSLTSAAFKDGAAIPVKHTCDGADVSPPLAWTGAPAA